MSFVEDGEEVRRTVEPLIKNLATDFAGKKLLSEDIPRIPLRRGDGKVRLRQARPALWYGAGRLNGYI